MADEATPTLKHGDQSYEVNEISVNVSGSDSLPETTSTVFGDIKLSGSFSFEGECPRRDILELFLRKESVGIETEIPGFEDGTYRWCDYCEGDSLVKADQYEDHLSEIHNLER